MHFGYTSAGLLTELRDARGNLKEYDYDTFGRLELAEDAEGGSKTLARSSDPNSLNVEITTALDRTSGYGIEALPTGAQVWTNTDPAGVSAVSTIEPDGSVATAQPDGTATTIVEDGDPRFGMQMPLVKSASVDLPSALELALTAGRRVTLADPANPLSLTALVDSVIVNGRKFRSSYTQSSRTYTHTTPLNRVSVQRLDSLGRVVKDSVAGITAWTYEYDGDGRLARAQQGQREVEYGYDLLGRLASVTDPLGRTTSLEYDAAGRLTRQLLPDSSEIVFGYDANGNLTSLTPAGKPAHTFGYNGVDLVQSYTAPDLGSGSTTTEYTFDLDQQLTRVLRPDSAEITLAYDTAGRMSTVTIPRGTYGYTYDASTGQVESITSPDSVELDYAYDGALLIGAQWAGAVNGSVDVTYDNNFRVVKQRVNGADSVAFQYDDDGLLTAAGALTIARDPTNGLVTGTTLGSVTTSQTRDAFGNLASNTARFGSDTLFHTVYTRDALGRITRLVETIEGVTDTLEYSYDLVGRLTEVERNGTAVESYEYDANGNRTSYTGPSGTVTATYDDQDRLLTYGDASYSYTAAGELATKVEGTDTTHYVYDPLGSLVEVRLPDGTSVEYIIDGQNRRMGKKFEGELKQSLLYGDQLRPVAELDSLGHLGTRFVYAGSVNVPEYMLKDGVTFRILTDHLGSVRLVLDVSTGDVVQRIDYDAYGRVLQDTELDFQPFGFAGGITDGSTGLVRFGARDYEPVFGRWTSQDPIGFAGGSSNLYEYLGGDPLNAIDPNGLCAAAIGIATLSVVSDALTFTGAGLAIRAAIGARATATTFQYLVRDPVFRGLANYAESQALSRMAELYATATVVGELASSTEIAHYAKIAGFDVSPWDFVPVIASLRAIRTALDECLCQ